MDAAKIVMSSAKDRQNYLEVTRVEQTDFASLHDEWQALLERSEANPLFLSWAWIWSWWSVWQRALSLELYLITVRDAGGTLVGIAPLYRHQVDYAGVTTVTRLQCIGNAWKIAPTVRSEYISFIADEALELDVYQAISQFLQNQTDWDELVLCDLDRESRGFRIITALSRLNGYLLRSVSSDSGVRITISGEFSDYLQGLGSNTRLKLFNRRKRLTEMGELQQVRVSPEHYPEFFQALNQLHATRWGRGCYVGASEQFHLRLLSYLAPEQAHCLLLKQQDKVISALYDLELGGSRYNLQAGYLENYHPKVSLGTLHLGFGLEQAWQNPACHGYDLLAGRGKHSFYKQYLGRERTPFVTLQIVRSPKLWRLYPWVEKLPSKWRQWLKQN